MSKSKTASRHSLVMSILSLLVCVTMLLGTTFAWFTDTATASVNKIQAGTLDVALVDAEDKSLEGTTLSWVKADGHTEETVLWEPGCTYNLPTVYVKNNGNLALKYRIAISGIDGSAKLNEAIEWTMKMGTQELKLGTNDYTLLEANQKSEAITISGHMKEDAGNEYQGLSIDSVGITVYATQYTYEYDSSSNQYDKDSLYPALAPIIDKTEKVTIEAEEDIKVIKDGETVEADRQMLTTGDLSKTVKTTASTTDSVTLDISFNYAETVGDTTTNYAVTQFATARTTKVSLSTNLKSVKVTRTHGSEVTEFTAAASETAVGDGEFFYNPTTGDLTITSSKYSAFKVEYESDFPCAVGGQGYATLAGALEAAKAGEKVILMKDVDLTDYAANEGHVFELADNVTIDLQGKTITSNNFGVVYQGNGLVIKNGKFVAANNGSYALFVGDGEGKTVGAQLTDLTCTGGINVFNASATLTNCTATGTNYYGVWADENAQISIVSGTYTAAAGNAAVLAGESATITIAGGTYSSDPSEYVIDGYEAVAGANNWTVKKFYPVKVTLGATGEVIGFDTLEEAFTYNAANQGTLEAKNTIKLFKDIDYHEKYNEAFLLYVDLTNTVFDLNQKTFIVFGNSAICFYGHDFKICNGTVNDSRTIDSNNVGYAIRVGNYGAGEPSPEDPYAAANVEIDGISMRGGINCCNARNVSISNVTSTAMSTSRYCVCAQDCENVVIKSGTYTQSNPNCYATIADWYSYSIKIEGGTFKKAGPRTRDPYKGKYPCIVHYDGENFSDGEDLSMYVDSTKYNVSKTTSGGYLTLTVTAKGE